MTTLADLAVQLKSIRKQAGLSQLEVARRAGLNRMTVGRMENLVHGDMSVLALIRLLEAAGYDLKFAKVGHQRTLEDILAEQRTAFANEGIAGLSRDDLPAWLEKP
jgi:transcriptional regulator with XRE-family HTH domain